MAYLFVGGLCFALRVWAGMSIVETGIKKEREVNK